MPELHFASRDQIRHAYILSSADGDTAFSEALEIARAAVCRGLPPLPCGCCTACRKAAEGIHPDVRIVTRSEENGKKKQKILVDQVREISADAAVLPNEASRKVYVIREADTMNEEAQNAALKLLENMPDQQAACASIVTVFVDDNKKYLSADYAKEEPVRPGYLAPDVELTNVLAVR